MSASSRTEWITSEVALVFKNLSGRNFSDSDFQSSFFELGFDSLLLTQASQALRQKFGIKITFRQLMESLFTLDAVSAYVEKNADPAVAEPPLSPSSLAVADIRPPAARREPEAATLPSNLSGDDAVDRLVREQLAIMHQQLDLLRGAGKAVDEAAHLNGHATTRRPAIPASAGSPVPVSGVESTPRFGPYKPLDRTPGGGLTPRQQDHLDRLIAATVARTPRSKAHTQRHRAHFADPRTVAGFRAQWKELVYPIVVKHSEGSRFRDLDNNEYLDLTMGFGTNLFGHSPRFLTRAIAHQLRHGVEVGPQSAIAGKVAQLLCELTGAERAAFCSTGSEAILAAIRLARTVSGRTKIATMGGYHGINDEVLVRAAVVDGIRRPVPVAPGVPQHSVDEVLVLDYGTSESLDLLRAHAHELAAVLVEPVQSRKPELQPVEFLREVRKITAASETALVFDEIITGFRSHPGGTQALWGIEADLATYGKIIGGGMPIGALCGKAKYMDALDGGNWSYGDDSSPEVGMTFFAGTYVRHPLAVRAALSVLQRLKREGPALQEQLSARATRLAETLNGHFEREKIPMRVTWFRSMLYFVFQQEFKYSALLFAHLRLKGIHIWEGRPIFIATTHTDEEIDFVFEAFKNSLAELKAGDFLPKPDEEVRKTVSIASTVSRPSSRPTDFSLYFFGNYDAAFREDKYELLLEAAKFGDTHGFSAIWLPERHFHSVGGFSPNSSLLACALAPVTSKIKLRGGSVVLPLHHPVRVAEEWAVADNLSQGRTAISMATGWHPNDFVFAPEAFPERHKIAMKNLQVIQKLWRGEPVELPVPGGATIPIQLHPMPKQRELPVWLTCIHRESYHEAGKGGFNVLGYLMNQTVAELGEKIAAYREGRRSAGLGPAQGHVTTLLFTYLEGDAESARQTAREPLCAYLRSYLNNSEKKIKQELGDVSVDEEDVAYLTNRSCDDYFKGKSLIGSPESCQEVVEKLREIGVDEIGCFVDFGVPADRVLKSLELITGLMPKPAAASTEDFNPPDMDTILPLPAAEQGLWLLSSMEGDAARAYRESVTLRLEGELDRAALERALRKVAARHGALRTTISRDGQSQTVSAQAPVDLLFLDFSFFPPAEAREKVLAKLEEMEGASFDLEGPFLESHLVRIEPSRHLLVLFFHHLVGNGPSYWVALEELAELYAEYAGGAQAKLPEPVPFAEFVAHRKAYETSPEKKEAEEFWIGQLGQGIPALDLPYDHALPRVLTYRGSRQEMVIDAALAEKLRKLGSSHRGSLFMVLLATYGILLHRLSGQDDVVMGVPFDSPFRAENAGRNLFANTTNMLPLRSRLSEGLTFAAYFDLIKELVLGASEHQDYFFGSLLGKLKISPNPARSPFFNVIFNLETGNFRREAPGLIMELETRDVPYRGPRDAAMFDLYLNAAERESGDILVQCDHNTALVSPETMKRWLGHFHSLLVSVTRDPVVPISELSLKESESLSETESALQAR